MGAFNEGESAVLSLYYMCYDVPYGRVVGARCM